MAAPAPTGLTAEAGDASGQIDMSWDQYPHNFHNYRLSWTADGESWPRANASDGNAYPTGSSHTVTGLDAGETYQFRIRATFNQGRSSPWSSTVSGDAAAESTIRNNSAPTGLPAITGSETVGETLTADTSSIADDDGLTGATYAYQWIRNDATDDTDISGATSSTYELTLDDLAHTIKVRVTFTDDGGTAETLTSAATGTINRPPNALPTGAPEITGTPEVDEVLTADTSDISDANGLTSPGFTYQWVRTDGADTDISGATAQTYTVVDADEGSSLKVKVTFTDDDGYSATLTSNAVQVLETAQQGATVTLLSNTGQSTGTGTSGRISQTFTTGTSANGYTITSVGLRSVTSLAGTIDIGVRIFSTNTDGTPNDELYALTNPTTFTSGVVNTFTAPEGTTLEPSTTYAVMVSNADGNGNQTNYSPSTLANTNASTAETGWSIPAFAHKRSGGSWVTDTKSLLFEIKGSSIPVCVSEPEGGDFPAADTTGGRVFVGACFVTGRLTSGDSLSADGDFFKVHLEGGDTVYRAELLGKGGHDISNGGTFPGKPALQLVTSTGGYPSGSIERLNGFGEYTPIPGLDEVWHVTNIASGPDRGARIEFMVPDAADTGDFILFVTGDGSSSGTYTLRIVDITTEADFRDPYMPQNKGNFTSGTVAGRVAVDVDGTGNIGSQNDADWFMTLLEEDKIYRFEVMGDGLGDPELSVMKFYDNYERRFANTIPASDKDVAYYDELYINPDNFTVQNKRGYSNRQICNDVRPHGETEDKVICSYYYNDDISRTDLNSRITVDVAADGGGEYLIFVDGVGNATGTYTVTVTEID